MAVYAIVRGRQTGIYHTWNECKQHVDHFANARFKKFDNIAEATNYLVQHGVSVNSTHKVSASTGDLYKQFSAQKKKHPQNQAKLQSFFSSNVLPSETERQQQKHHTPPVTTTTPVPHTIHYVYTDGACKNNGKPNACAGAGVHFGKDDERNISVRIDGKQSNNTAEVVAILKACEVIAQHLNEHPDDRWVIVTDSQYALRYATMLGEKHARESWCQSIPNKQLVKHLYHTVSTEPRITLLKVAAHTNNNDPHSLGNEEADRLAIRAIGQTSCPYTRTYINVAYARKDEAKKLGAKWDKRKKQWFTLDNNPSRNALFELFGQV